MYTNLDSDCSALCHLLRHEIPSVLQNYTLKQEHVAFVNVHARTCGICQCMCRSNVSSTTSITTVICKMKTLSTFFDSLQQIGINTGLWYDGDKTRIYTSFRWDLHCLSAVLGGIPQKHCLLDQLSKWSLWCPFHLGALRTPLSGACRERVLVPGPPPSVYKMSHLQHLRKTNTVSYHISVLSQHLICCTKMLQLHLPHKMLQRSGKVIPQIDEAFPAQHTDAKGNLVRIPPPGVCS